MLTYCEYKIAAHNLSCSLCLSPSSAHKSTKQRANEQWRWEREGSAHSNTSHRGLWVWVLSCTSNRWELTFFPFFIQVMRGLGSPTAWHTNDATPPEIPVWSSGDLMKLGMPKGDRQRDKGEGWKTGKSREEKITSIRWRALTEEQLQASYRDFTRLYLL